VNTHASEYLLPDCSDNEGAWLNAEEKHNRAKILDTLGPLLTGESDRIAVFPCSKRNADETAAKCTFFLRLAKARTFVVP